MASALVFTKNVERPTTFRTSWSQFMKVCLKLFIQVSFQSISLVKSSGKLTYKPRIPKIFWEKLSNTDKIYIYTGLKANNFVLYNKVQAFEASEFTEEETVNDIVYVYPNTAVEMTVPGAQLTASKVYDLTVAFSDKEIVTEVVENPGDDPFTAYGKVAGYLQELTCGV